jgi:hypothetical protein
MPNRIAIVPQTADLRQRQGLEQVPCQPHRTPRDIQLVFLNNMTMANANTEWSRAFLGIGEARYK